MTQITASEVNNLRKQTGAGMMDCKKALLETNGDFDQAIDVLRKQGQKVAAKRADRETSEGVVLSMVNEKKTIGAVVSLNCETDFVAKNTDFVELAKSFLKLALGAQSESIESLKSVSFNSEMSIADKLVEQTGVIGEKLELNNYAIIQADYVSAYVHPGNKLASLVGLNQNGDDLEEIGRNVAMQIAAMNPLGLLESDIPQDIIEKEIEIGKDLARQEGKPDEMLEKISMGRLKKFFKENTLINQTYIKDSKQTIMQYLKSFNQDLNVTEFRRVNLS
tara:strand:- start:195 stop:1028 length:834 start_codon:yes stop_codon:yes gene_type:complete